MLQLTPTNSKKYLNDKSNDVYKIESAEVIDIILNDSHPDYKSVTDIGNIKFRKTQTEIGKNDKTLLYAKPLNPFCKYYPLIHEIVSIVLAPSPAASFSEQTVQYYYIQPVNVWSLINHNALPNSTKYYPQESNKTKSNNYSQFTGNNSVTTTSEDIKFGETFNENPDVLPLHPYEGDRIYYGRFGQSMRFGSTVKKYKNDWSKKGDDGDPIIIISNTKQQAAGNKNIRIEDINADSSSIYICDGQMIPIKASSTNLKSYGTDKPEYFDKYAGKQIIMNSDRIVLNAKKDSVFLIGSKAVGLLSKNNVNVDADKNIIMNAQKYLLGANATEKVIFGNKFMTNIMQPLLLELSSLIIDITGTSGTVNAKSITKFGELLTKLNSMLSQKVYVE
jgi:hypothetical protein